MNQEETPHERAKRVNRELEEEKVRREPEKQLPEWALPIYALYQKNERYKYYSLKQGQFFLFQTIGVRDGVTYMDRPVFAMLVEHDSADQAGVIRYAEFGRTWENNRLGGWMREAKMCEQMNWYKWVYIVEMWDNKPDWKQLLKAYRNSFYYGKPKRVNKVNAFLGTLR